MHVTKRCNPLSVPSETVLKSIWHSCLSSLTCVYHRRWHAFTQSGEQEGYSPRTVSRPSQAGTTKGSVCLKWWPLCTCVSLPLGFPRCILPMHSCPNQAGYPSLVASLSRCSPSHPQKTSSTEELYLVPAQQDHLQGFLPSRAVPFIASHTFFPPMEGKSNVLHKDLPLVCSLSSAIPLNP